MLNEGYLLNSYQIQSVIGHGGFGVVYKGIHRELESDVAIKEYFPSELCTRQDNVVVHSKPEFQSAFDENLNRFIKEAQQLQKFRSSPNIVTCTDLFRANGTAYIVMEYVDGLPLSVLLERRESHGKPFTEQDMLQVILPLLNALQTVHELGVCHRDIKPSNILIRSSDSTPVLIDFGAAKHEISRDTKSFAPYSDGYAAMEQIGEGEIGTWTDIYGIGALMWRMVAGGNPPYSPPNPHSSQKRAFELMQGRRDPLPSAVEIGGRQFSERTLLTIDNCLAINVRDRIQDCAQLLESLNNEDDIDRDAPQNFASQGEKNDINSDSLHQTTAQPSRKKSDQKNKNLPPKALVLSLGILLIFIIIGIVMITKNEAVITGDNTLEEIIKAANRGQASAQSILGERYYHGDGVEQDYTEAIKWLRLAAEEGDANAQFYLGLSHSLGQGVVQDDREALKWHRLAAQQGIAESQFYLGLIYDSGNGVPENDREAVKWYRLAAEQGYDNAQYYLGLSYDLGEGVIENDSEAVKWYRQAANQGHADAQFYLGLSYDIGEGVLENDQEAVNWYRRAADQGHADAQFHLGMSYSLGDGVLANDQQAITWYRQSALQGHAEAQLSLGLVYDSGSGVPENDREAVKWYRLAAEQGDANAQYYLGLSYDLGEGVIENDAMAVIWYRRAADQGHADAQFFLGLNYYLGEGVPKNDMSAIRWYRLAAEQGHPEARAELSRLLNQ